MATQVNYRDTRIDSPTITVTGTRVDTTDGSLYSEEIVDVENPSNPSLTTYTTTTSIDYSFSAEDVVVGANGDNTVRNEDPYTFSDSVTVTITPDSDFTSNSYANRSSSDIIGKTPMGSDGKVNQYAETYYTVNGKDPSRTKAHLYTGAFSIRSNKFGSSDNIILKARTYQGGNWSKVTMVEIRIIKADENAV